MKLTRLLFLLYLLGACANGIAEPLKVGDRAPNFKAKTLDGEVVSLADFAGQKNVYLKFWATWCHYCKAEMPLLQEISNHKSDDLEILLINVGINDSVEKIQSYFKKEGFDMPVIFDAMGDIVSTYNVVGTPQQFLIGKNGDIRYQTFLMTDEFETLLSKL